MSEQMYDFQKFLEQMAEMQKQTQLTIQVNSEQLGTIATKVKENSIKIRETAESFESFKDDQETRWKRMAEKERIEEEEAGEIDDCITNRISVIAEEHKWSDEDYMRYFGGFKKQAWIDGKKHSYVVGKKGISTKKCFFEDVKNYYASWTPYGWGVKGYMSHLDKVREMRGRG